MPILLDALRVFEDAGFRIRTGLNPVHFDNRRDAMFTALYRDGRLAPGVGLAVEEVYFLECLFAHIHPRKVLVIGNAFGWSTVVLALLNPDAHVLALDSAEEADAARGIQLTNFLAKRAGLNARAVKGASPGDVAPLVKRHLAGAVDVALIDGEHTEHQQRLDFDAVRTVASPDCLYLFHDVINYAMTEGFREIAKTSGLEGRILERTPSGLGVLHSPSLPEGARCAIAAFAERAEHVDDLRRRIAAGETSL
jgi:predicted O-methyltransferase YrrM